MRLLADLRFTLRQFRNAPVFTITILAVLALGVGATTAIFGLFDQVLLRTLPVSHPEELVRVQAHMETFSGSMSARGGDLDEYSSYPAYRYLRDNTGAIFSGIIASNPENTVGVAWHDRSDSQMQSWSAETTSRCWAFPLSRAAPFCRPMTQSSSALP